MPAIVHPAGEVVISIGPVSVFANGPASEIGQLQDDLHGRWRQATRAVMVLLSLRGLPPAQIAGLLDCHPATVRRWIARFNAEGGSGAGRPAPVRAPPARRPPAGRTDRRAAGPSGPVDAAPDLAVPGPARYQPPGRCTGGSGWWRSGGGRS